MPVAGFDHVALPIDRPEEMIRFYGRLGFRVPEVEAWRASEQPFFSIFFADQRINFHTPRLWKNPSFALRSLRAAPGCGDLCFVWEGGSESLEKLLAAAGIPLVAGPVELEGGRGKGRSVYVRDPDDNLIEFIIYAEPAGSARGGKP